jgi:hypothetical protein
MVHSGVGVCCACCQLTLFIIYLTGFLKIIIGLLHCQEKTRAKKRAKVAAKLDACGVTAQ